MSIPNNSDFHHGLLVLWFISDYRDVGTGTKVPFLHINQHYDERPREMVTLVQDNVPIDDSAFAKPNTMRRFER